MAAEVLLLGDRVARPRTFSFTPDAAPRSCVYVAVLTGGPGGGKSTARGSIADRLRSLGFQVRPALPREAGGGAKHGRKMLKKPLCFRSFRAPRSRR